MPGRRRGAHRSHRCLHITARESGAHPRQVDPVGFTEPLEEMLPDGSGPSPEDPGRREVDDVQSVVSAEQHIAVVEIRQSHPAAVEFIEDRTESVKQRVIEPGSRAIPQWLGVHPAGGQGMGSEAAEKCRQGINAFRRLVRRRLAADQPTPDAVPNHGASRRIGLDRHPLAIQVIEKNISLGSIAAHNPANRLDIYKAIGVERASALGV